MKSRGEASVRTNRKWDGGSGERNDAHDGGDRRQNEKGGWEVATRERTDGEQTDRNLDGSEGAVVNGRWKGKDRDRE